jgi:hypothetical protein
MGVHQLTTLIRDLKMALTTGLFILRYVNFMFELKIGYQTRLPSKVFELKRPLY